jgi:hypothetical protein
MPQASNSGIPPAYDEYEVTRRKKGIEEEDRRPGRGRISSVTHASSPQQRGVFPFSWGWQLAGLISAIVTGFLLSIASLDPQLPLLFVGLVLLGLSIYSAMETNWLRDAAAKPLLVKIGAGTAVICGLVPIAALLLSAVIVGGICAVALGALGGK